MDLIAILEDDARRLEAMDDALDELGLAHGATYFTSAPEVIAWLEEHLARVSLVCLGRTDGSDVADWLAGRAPACPVLLHADDDRARRALETSGWKVDCVSPVDDLAWVRREWIRAVRESLGIRL